MKFDQSVRLLILLTSFSIASIASAETKLHIDAFGAAPPNISAGDSSTWALGFSLIDAIHVGEQFSQASLTFASGDGQTYAFNGPIGGTSASTSATFAYGVAGQYWGSVFGTVQASWQEESPIYSEDRRTIIGYETVMHSETLGISGVPGQISTSWWTIEVVGTMFDPRSGGLIDRYDYVEHTQGVNYGPLTVAAVIPEPETYAMLIGGLGLLGAVARRRKQKSAT